MNTIKKLICRHKNNEVVCWNWTHGLNGNHYRFIEVQRLCKDCGKYYFRHIQDEEKCDEFADAYYDKQWSDTFKAILDWG